MAININDVYKVTGCANGINVTVVGDTILPNGKRVTSMLLNLPRMILSELSKHRVFSMSSASSRAVPSAKMRASVSENMFIPLKMLKSHKGMSTNEYFVGKEELELIELWKKHGNALIQASSELEAKGLSKQLSNRFLEPVQYIKVLVTSTEWDNFFSQRIDSTDFVTNSKGEKVEVSSVEQHLRSLAILMKNSLNTSVPERKTIHIPYFDYIKKTSEEELSISEIIRYAVVLCAKTSFVNFDISPAKDDKIFKVLSDNKHLVPFEHICGQSGSYIQKGNLINCTQLRSFIELDSDVDIAVFMHAVKTVSKLDKLINTVKDIFYLMKKESKEKRSI